jgi:hypothetical protein
MATATGQTERQEKSFFILMAVSALDLFRTHESFFNLSFMGSFFGVSDKINLCFLTLKFRRDSTFTL